MIRAILNLKKVRMTIEKAFDEWDLRWTEEQVKRDISYQLDSKIAEEVLKHVQMNLDQAIMNKIAKELLESYDLKPVIEEAMQLRVRDFVYQTVGVTQELDSYGRPVVRRLT